MENIWKRFWQKTSKEKNYLKEIEQKIEAFRLMSEEDQIKYFINSSVLTRNDLVEGGFDNKVQIKYWMRFIKGIKTGIFFPQNDVAVLEIADDCTPAFMQIEKFINELHGVEKIKENDFLNILSHENKTNFNNSLKYALVHFRKTIFRLHRQKLDIAEHKNFAAETVDVFVSEERNIKKIIGAALRKIAEQDKINKLKTASNVFKKRAKRYRGASAAFLILGVLLVWGVFLFVFNKDFSEYNIKFPEESNANSSAFYIYVILETLFRGKLMFSIITLTGFFYCLRFFAASQHNAIICDQRANTLESFEALYENVEEDKERLLVVEKVLNSATEHLPTGFSKLQSDSGGGGIDLSKLLSLFKGK